MSVLNVALLQMTSCGIDQDANLTKGEEFCRKAKDLGADVALFPEMWSVGYTFDHRAGDGAPQHRSGQQDAGNLWRAPELWLPDVRQKPVPREAIERWQALAVARDGRFMGHFRALARELGMAIAITYLEEWAGPPRNSVSLIDRRGELVMTYAKVHTCDFDLPEMTCTPGDGFGVCELDTEAGPVAVGAMICYDREFPESARVLMLEGAEIVLTPNACELEGNRIGQFRARAYENMVGVAMTNYAAPQHNGHSIAFDPIAFDANGDHRDTLVVEAGEREGVHVAPFDLDELRSYRSRETWGNAFRKPHRYGSLTSLAIERPFVRVNADGKRYDPTKR